MPYVGKLDLAMGKAGFDSDRCLKASYADTTCHMLGEGVSLPVWEGELRCLVLERQKQESPARGRLELVLIQHSRQVQGQPNPASGHAGQEEFQENIILPMCTLLQTPGASWQ